MFVKLSWNANVTRIREGNIFHFVLLLKKWTPARWKWSKTQQQRPKLPIIELKLDIFSKYWSKIPCASKNTRPILHPKNDSDYTFENFHAYLERDFWGFLMSTRFPFWIPHQTWYVRRKCILGSTFNYSRFLQDAKDSPCCWSWWW